MWIPFLNYFDFWFSLHLCKKENKVKEVISSILCWQLRWISVRIYVEGEKVVAVTDFILLGSKITADGDCSHKIKRHLLLRQKAMTNLDNILKKQKHHFADKSPYL